MPATAEQPANEGWHGHLLAEVRRLVPPVPERGLDWRAGVATLGLVAVGAVLSLERQRGAGALHTLWAEDGKIFLTDVLNRSVVDALARTYNGYLHLAARAIASVTVLLPVRYAAAALSGAGAVGAAAVAALHLVVSYPAYGSRGRGPTWEEGLIFARTRCVSGVATVKVPITPHQEGLFWHVTSPCNRLLA